MIEKILNHSIQLKGHEISFILGHKVLAKTGADWFELKGDSFSLSEWEDLKDLCLQSTEKIQLETKGCVAGFFNSSQSSWRFSFTEKKDCFRAYLSFLTPVEQITADIEYPLFWDMAKKEKGIFIVAGEKRHGKSALLAEIIVGDQKNKMSLVGVHSLENQLHWPSLDSFVYLGADSDEYAITHPIYDGIEKFVVDMNSIRSIKKWIEFSEQGQSVFISVSVDSIKSFFQKISSELDSNYFVRFINALNGVVVQKLVSANKIPVHEILVLKESEKIKLNTEYSENKSGVQFNIAHFSNDCYQSLNQSLIQKMIRRKLDVQSAFSASDDPESLDKHLKKLGL